MSLGRFQFRRDVAVNWSTQNPVLLEGELGLETDTRQFKIGNGVTAWSSLPYGGIEGGIGPQGEQGPAGPAGPVGTPETLQPLIDSAAQSAASAGESAALAAQSVTDAGESQVLAAQSATAAGDSAVLSAQSATAAGQSATFADQRATAAEQSAAEAENVKDIAVAAFNASNVYETIALGRAAVADGEFFWVRPGGSDGLDTPTLYRRDSAATQTLVYAQPTIGPDLAQVPTGQDLVDAGISTLRADLASTDVDKGAGIISRGVVALNAITDFLSIPAGLRTSDRRYLVASFWQGLGMGGGAFKWSADKNKSDHDGVLVVDPDRLIELGGPSDADPYNAYFTASVSGSGVFVALDRGEILLDQAGALSGKDSYKPFIAAINASRASGIKTISTIANDFMLSNTVKIENGLDDGLKLRCQSGPLRITRMGTVDDLRSCFSSDAYGVDFGSPELTASDDYYDDYRAGIEFRGGSAVIGTINIPRGGLGGVYVKDAPADFTLRCDKIIFEGIGRAFATDAVNVKPGAIYIDQLISEEGGTDTLDVSAGSVKIGTFLCKHSYGRAFKKGSQASGGEIEIGTFKYLEATYEKRLQMESLSAAFKRGEAITGGTSGATATIVSRAGLSRATLNVADIVGVFQAGETVTGAESGATGSIVSVGNKVLYEVIGQSSLPIDLLKISTAIIDAGNGAAIDLPFSGEIDIGRLELLGGGNTTAAATIRLDGFVGVIGELIARGASSSQRTFLLQGADSDILFKKVCIKDTGVEGFRSFAGRMCFENVDIDGVNGRGIVWEAGAYPYLLGGVIKNIAGGNRPWEVKAGATNPMIAHVRYTGFPTNGSATLTDVVSI